MAEERSSETAPKRRARRATGTRSARTTRTTRGAAATRRRTGGGDMVQNLNGMIDELIKENRKLKRQVDRLTAKGAAVASSGIERGLKSIQRRVQKALTGTTTTRRRTTRRAAGTTATRRRRTTTTRRRRSASSGESSAS